MEDADPFQTPPTRQMNQFEIRIPSFRAAASAPVEDEDVDMSSSVAAPSPARNQRNPNATQDDISDSAMVPSPPLNRFRASSPVAVNRAPVSPMGSPTPQGRLLPNEGQDSEMDNLEIDTSKLALQGQAPMLSSPAPASSGSPEQTMDDVLMAVYEESQLESAVAREAKAGSQSLDMENDSTQRLTEKNQFEEYS
jgi:hypothetical protein